MRRKLFAVLVVASLVFTGTVSQICAAEEEEVQAIVIDNGSGMRGKISTVDLSKKLSAVGIKTMGQLAKMDTQKLAAVLKKVSITGTNTSKLSSRVSSSLTLKQLTSVANALKKKAVSLKANVRLAPTTFTQIKSLRF